MYKMFSSNWLPRARMREAGLSNGFCPSVCQCVSHQNFGLITTTKGLNTCKRHSNNDNSEKIVYGQVYLKVAEASLIRANFLAVVSFLDCTNLTGDETIVAEDTNSVNECWSRPTPLESYSDNEIRSGSAG